MFGQFGAGILIISFFLEIKNKDRFGSLTTKQVLLGVPKCNYRWQNGEFNTAYLDIKQNQRKKFKMISMKL